MSADDPAAYTPPLKRHPALQPLSREHMSGLVQARKLAAAAAQANLTARVRAVAEFAAAWRREISHHFDDEERMLLPILRSAELRDRLLAEHRHLRELAERATADADSFANDPANMRQLAQLLHDHIRWEERVLFEAAQRDHPKAMAALITHAEQIEATRPGARPRKRLDEQF